ncbi:MAG: hypothetical protein WCT07_02445 [Candidatus Paceibacterota bacterium]|jgi:hypothetical protein
MKKALISLSVMGTSVMLALAQGGTITIGVGSQQGQIQGGALLQLLALAQTIVTRLVPFMIGLAVIAFFWFLVEFIWLGRNDPKKHEGGLKGMGYSILALFVMVSIWGLVGFFGSIFGIGQGGNIPIPGIPVPAN